MCTVCGCGKGETRIEGREHPHDHPHEHVHVHAHGHEHVHADGTTHNHVHDHDHSHTHTDHRHHHDLLHAPDAVHSHAHHGDLHYGLGPAHAHAPGLSQERMIRIEQDILGKNNAYAAGNRKHFAEHGIFAVNLVSSPGSGKTTLLVKSIEMLQDKARVAVVEGDQQTSNDADRIRATGAPAIQVNTGKGCHLDAHMVGHALEHLNLADDSLLMIENVGNLVCPAAFDLGEAHKVVILSVTEGEDKPLKYPDMFHAADLMILNKVDLLPYLSFDVGKCVDYARRVNPRLQVMQVSATSGQGMEEWLGWLMAGLDEAKSARMQNVDLLKKRIAELEARLGEQVTPRE
ncbi:MAG TPA: hydrogenase nickel incorporation protein HypB [Thiobacillaceae bacterium]|nr:hydrogenase nickel incorporation protein HypB [Thiobacillaceae bacterium]HNU63317.1 hydrogenase nickel incorporation protein HypB [Thiobacillaceae bacterium]